MSSVQMKHLEVEVFTENLDHGLTAHKIETAEKAYIHLPMCERFDFLN